MLASGLVPTAVPLGTRIRELVAAFALGIRLGEPSVPEGLIFAVLLHRNMGPAVPSGGSPYPLPQLRLQITAAMSYLRVRDVGIISTCIPYKVIV